MEVDGQVAEQGFEPTPDCLLPVLSPRAELAVLARALYREGYEEHIAGHISYKQPDGTLLVNPFHLRWDEVRAKHVCRIDLDGNVLEGDWFVSTAIELHLQLHRVRDDVTVAVHNHSRWGTVWASLKRVPPVHDQTSSLVDNEIAVHDEYDRPVGDAEEALAAVESLGKAKAALLGHHGVLVVGDDVGQAYARCMSLEWRCRMAWYVEAVGGAPAMPPESSQRLARGIDRRGYPGLWEAMARQEIQLDPRVLEEPGLAGSGR
jgi:L-fuculose-phosphate aldolase